VSYGSLTWGDAVSLGVLPPLASFDAPNGPSSSPPRIAPAAVSPIPAPSRDALRRLASSISSSKRRPFRNLTIVVAAADESRPSGGGDDRNFHASTSRKDGACRDDNDERVVGGEKDRASYAKISRKKTRTSLRQLMVSVLLGRSDSSASLRHDDGRRPCGIAPRPSKWGRRNWSAWGEGPPKRTTYMSRVAVSNLLYYQIVQDRKMQP
jgi:hypothetical protein